MLEKKQNSLLEGPVGRTLLMFALPFLASSFLQALYGAVDLLVVGQFSDSAAVSAVAVGSQMMQTVTGIILGISMGGTVLIGRRIGERNDRGAALAVGTLAIMFTILALVLTPAMFFLLDAAIEVMETPIEAMYDTKQYLVICTLGLPFIIGYNGVCGIFRGIGDSKTPVYFIGIACVINIIGDLILTGAMGMGAAGAAAATVLAQAVSFVSSLAYMYKKGLSFPFHKNDLRLERGSVLYILMVGLPLALQDALVNVSFLVITAIINTMGVIASASVGVVEKIIVFAMLPPSAFASAVAPMTSQNMGAGKKHRARKSLWCGAGYSFICGICVFLYCQFLPETLTALFARDPAVISSAALYLKSYSIDCMFVSFVFCMNSYLSGCGKSIISFAHSMAATFAVRIPLTFFLSKITEGNLYAMGFAAPAASVLSIAICSVYIVWKDKDADAERAVYSG